LSQGRHRASHSPKRDKRDYGFTPVHSIPLRSLRNRVGMESVSGEINPVGR
jgi:hypothetical protein